jgi:CRP-like cAMP-binding protein
MANERVFISYRRADQPNDVDRVRKRLERELGSVSFVDAYSIGPAEDFAQRICKALAGCEILLAIIGPRWVDLFKDRIDGETDYVRVEIGEALKRGIPIIPVLLNRAKMPSDADLPPGLQTLAGLQAIVIQRKRGRDDGLEDLVWVLHSRFLKGLYEGQGRIDGFRNQTIVKDCKNIDELSKALANKSELETLPKGKKLYPIGGPGHRRLYFVFSGGFTLRAAGRRHNYHLKPNEIVGEFPILLKSQPRYAADVEAREPSAVAWVSATDFEAIADANPDLWRSIGKVLVQRLMDSNSQHHRLQTWAIRATAALLVATAALIALSIALAIVLLRG